MTGIRKRDLIVGYVEQLKPYGYPPERLVSCPMIVNTRIFRPRELTDDERRCYGSDLMFASNCGIPTEEIVGRILEEFNGEKRDLGCARETLEDVHEHLWRQYRDGKSFTTYDDLKKELLANDEGAADSSFAPWFSALPEEAQDYVMQRLFWRLNDIIYRQTVVEWIIEFAETRDGTGSPTPFSIRLYGRGWRENPRFAKYACGPIAHGDELDVAILAARFSLHLNANEGQHQRIGEILSAGGRILTRRSRPVPNPELHRATLKMLEDWRTAMKKGATFAEFDPFQVNMSDPERTALAEWIFNLTMNEAKKLATEKNLSEETLRLRTRQKLEGWIDSQPEWPLPYDDDRYFSSKQQLWERLNRP
jgi:hypothetical protein